MLINFAYSPARLLASRRSWHRGLLACLALSVAASGCGSDALSLSAKIGTVIDEVTVIVGGSAQKTSMGTGDDFTEMSFAPAALPKPTRLTMRLSKGVAKTGPQPSGPAAQMATKGVMLDIPAQLQQTMGAPPAGMKYMSAYADEADDAWTPLADARLATVLGATAGDPTKHTWEIDVHHSGLWIIALVPITDPGTPDAGATTDAGTDSGATDAGKDSGATTDAGTDGVGTSDASDAGTGATDPSTRPQLTQLVPAQGTAGTPVSLEIHGRNIAAGWTIMFDGTAVATTIAPVTLGGASDGNGALGAVMLDAAIATGQVPVWLEAAGLRSNTLYFNIAPIAGAPTILDYTPDNAVPGTMISIIGTNFTAEPVTIRDPLGRPIPVQATGTTTWVGVTRERVDVIIPADMTSGVLTATNSKGSFRGRVFNVGVNLAHGAGATAQSSTQYNTTNWSMVSGWDNNLQTSWFSANYDCATSTSCTSVPFFQITFASPQPVSRIAMRGNREYASGYDYLEGWFEVRAADGAVLWKASYVLPEPDRDLDIVFATPIPGASAVRFTSIADESLEPGFSELEVF